MTKIPEGFEPHETSSEDHDMLWGVLMQLDDTPTPGKTCLMLCELMMTLYEKGYSDKMTVQAFTEQISTIIQVNLGLRSEDNKRVLN